MKNQGYCPKCAHKVLYAVEQATIKSQKFADRAVPLSVAAEYVNLGGSGFFGEKKAMVEATVEAWVCASCGYTELYTREIETLALLEEQGGADGACVRRVDNS